MRACCFVVLSLLALLPPFAKAQAPAATAPSAPTAQTTHSDVKTTASAGAAAQALEATDLQAFFDGVLPLQMERSDIAGSSVLVMQDGKVLLQKGYGFADQKTKRPVDPETTIFRLASISKLFTWVSIMQLEEQGKLDIDADVNKYLDFVIRPAFSRPVTLRNLMTHTGGFEEESRDVILTDPKKAISLHDFLIQNQPERLFAPGTVPAYSNYGVGLAGYIVQRISGEPFEEYVQNHIFGPLKMVHSTFYQPPPKALSALPSEGYRSSTEKPPVGFEIFNPAPAGGISSTAVDMGRFGQALLNGGELDGQRILKPETLAAMWQPQFRASDQLPPICMGFYQTWRNQLRWIGHEGDLIAFHSLFFLEPSKKLLVFVSFNSAGGGDKPRPEIIDMFSDRYFPSESKQAFVKAPLAELRDIDGTYQSTRRADSNKSKLADLFEQRDAKVDKDGVLKIDNSKDLRDHPIRWKPIGKDLWQEVDGQQRLFAIRNPQGRIVRLAGDFPGVQRERVPWYENSAFVFTVVGASLATTLLVVLASLSRLGRRLFLRRRPRPVPQLGTRWLPLRSQMAAWLWSLLLLTIGIFLAVTGDELTPPTYSWDKYMIMINVVTVFAIFLSLLAVLAGARIWSNGGLRIITKVKYSAVAIACAVLSWFAIHWHLIGPVRL